LVQKYPVSAMPRTSRTAATIRVFRQNRLG
jgi:hypothetical protein